ncbi:MAG: hypothetical protein V8T07_00650 [Muribaculaceae bacterium]
MVKITRIATRGIAEEFRDMNVGDVVQFPCDKYNPTSVRSCTATTLLPDRMNEGKAWSAKTDFETKSMMVTRTA